MARRSTWSGTAPLGLWSRWCGCTSRFFACWPRRATGTKNSNRVKESLLRRDPGRLFPCEKALAVLVFPVALLSFGDPLDSRCDPLVARLGALGLCDPLDVFALATGAERSKCGGGLLVFFQRGGEFGRRFECGFRGLHNAAASGDGAGVLAAVNEGRRLANPVDDRLFGRQVVDSGDAAERAHAVALHDICLAQSRANFHAPEAK